MPSEAQARISGNNRAIFEYFIGAKVGLTATPKDYLKGVKDKQRQNDPREFERRLLLDTYRTFGCAEGHPSFVMSNSFTNIRYRIFCLPFGGDLAGNFTQDSRIIMRAKSKPFVTLALPVLFTSLALAESGDNWPRWRGPQDSGSNDRGSYPVKWDGTTNLLWKTALPGPGCSTPIVWSQRIYLTAPIDGQDAALAFDWSGKLIWQTALGRERPGKNRNGSGCNPSPATDGHGLFVYFKSGLLAGLELDGRLRWKTNLQDRFGKDTVYWDIGTSPVLTEKDVVIAVMHHGESYLAAFDKLSGNLRWKVARNYETPVEGDHSYATPLLYQHRGKETLLVWGAEHLTAHDPADGKMLWSCGDFNPEQKNNWVVVASPVIAGDMAIVPYGRGSRLFGIKLGGTGDATATRRIWKREGTGTFVPTPAEDKDRVYLLRDRGEIECIDPATGQTLWSGALPKASSSYYASPAIADGKLYAAREDGVVFVARVEGKFEVLAENPMGERVIASPVPVSNRLFIRGEKHLFCVRSNLTPPGHDRN